MYQLVLVKGITKFNMKKQWSVPLNVNVFHESKSCIFLCLLIVCTWIIWDL